MRGQSAVEFMIMVGVVLFFFTAFFFSLQESIADKLYERQDLLVKEIALTVQEEIELAHKSSEGYERAFSLPERVFNLNYSVQIISDSVYIETEDEAHAVALPVADVIGEVQKGSNVIRKINGSVFLNS